MIHLKKYFTFKSIRVPPAKNIYSKIQHSPLKNILQQYKGLLWKKSLFKNVRVALDKYFIFKNKNVSPDKYFIFKNTRVILAKNSYWKIKCPLLKNLIFKIIILISTINFCLSISETWPPSNFAKYFKKWRDMAMIFTVFCAYR